MQNTEFILLSLFTNYCISFHATVNLFLPHRIYLKYVKFQTCTFIFYYYALMAQMHFSPIFIQIENTVEYGGGVFFIPEALSIFQNEFEEIVSTCLAKAASFALFQSGLWTGKSQPQIRTKKNIQDYKIFFTVLKPNSWAVL